MGTVAEREFNTERPIQIVEYLENRFGVYPARFCFCRRNGRTGIFLIGITVA